MSLHTLPLLFAAALAVPMAAHAADAPQPVKDFV